MLEGKAKELFEKWGMENGYRKTHKILKNSTAMIEHSFNTVFYCNSIAEKWGVYQDFIDSLEYYISEGKDESFDGTIWYFLEIEKDGKVIINNYFKTRNEARIKAIEKLNNKINESTL